MTAPVALALVLSAAAPQAARSPERFLGSRAAQELAAKGKTVVAEKLADLDRDGVPEVVVVEGELGPDGPDPQKLALSVWRVAPGAAGKAPDWTLSRRSPEVPGSRVGLFQVAPLGCGSGDPVALVELVDESPDESRRTILIWGGPPGEPKELFRSAAMAGDRPTDLVDAPFGGDPLGLAVRDVSGDGVPELLVQEDPVILELRAPSGEAREVLVGYRQRTFGCRDGKFVEQGSARAVDLLRPVAHGAGAAGDGKPATGVVVQPGAKVTLGTVAGGRVRALRAVPGCGADAGAWQQRGEVRALKVEGLGAAPLELDLRQDVPSRSPAVLAAGAVPLGGVSFGRQVVVVLREPVATTGPLQVEITAADASGGCIGELEAY